MTVAVLHRVPRSVTPLDQWLAPILPDVTLLTSNDAADDYGKRIDSVIAFSDYANDGAVLDSLRELCGAGGISRIVHVAEADVLRAAQLRDEFDLPGIRTSAALAYRDKLVMKERVAAAGIPTPRFLAPDSADAAAKFAASAGCPVVVKPRLGVGSRGLEIVAAPAGLGALVPDSWPALLVEEYISGGMKHVDGFMSDGTVTFAAVSEYVNDCLSYRQSVPLGSVQLDRSGADFARVEDFARRVVRALPPTDFSPFHLEVFVREADGELVFCEIACRLGGGYIMDTLGLALGENPAAIAIRHQAGLIDGARLRLAARPGSHGFLLVPPRRGRLIRVDTPPARPYLTDFHVHSSWPREFDGASSSGDFVCAFVVSGQDEHATRQALADCFELAADCIQWE
jgi:biotin carboxylase